MVEYTFMYSAVKHILMSDAVSKFSKIAPMRKPRDFTGEKWTLIQVLACSR